MVEGIARSAVELWLARGEVTVVGNIGDVFEESDPGLMVSGVGGGRTHIDVENSSLGVVDGDLQSPSLDGVKDLVEDVDYQAIPIEKVIMLGDETTDFASISQLFDFSNNAWTNILTKHTQHSMEEELALYELLDLDAEGEDDVDVEFDETTEQVLIG